MKTALISLDELYLFVRVAKSHFINLVAKEEGMTPSAVSQAIFRLEKDVGFELFQRESRPLKLIAAGKRLLEEAPKLLLTAKELPLKLKRTSPKTQKPRSFRSHITFRDFRVGDSHDGSLGHEGAVSKSRNTQHREFAHETSS